MGDNWEMPKLPKDELLDNLVRQLLQFRKSSLIYDPDKFRLIPALCSLSIVETLARVKDCDSFVAAKFAFESILDSSFRNHRGNYGRIFFGAEEDEKPPRPLLQRMSDVARCLNDDPKVLNGDYDAWSHSAKWEQLARKVARTISYCESKGTLSPEGSSIEGLTIRQTALAPPPIVEAIGLLRDARMEQDVTTTCHHLQTALNLLADVDPDDSSRLLTALVERELAWETRDAHDRSMHWENALRSLRDPEVEETATSQLVGTYAAIAVDAFQDQFSDMRTGKKRTLFARAKKEIGKLTGRALPPEQMGILLARRAAILRAELGYPDRHEEDRASPLKCAQRALGENTTDVGIPLEVGLCEWMHARHQPNDRAYAAELRSAEAHIAQAADAGLDEGRLTLARFHRMTNRPLEALGEYPKLWEAKQRRRLLRDSWILAESVTQMHYGSYPRDLYAVDSERALRLLEEAIESGYEHARLVIDLAMLYFFEGDTEQAKTVITSELVTGKGMRWDRILEMLGGEDPKELPAKGFALGINSSASLSKIGTFVLDVVGDRERAEAIYRSALTLGPKDAVVLTNLARLLIGKGTDEATEESKRLLQLARTYSDRGFQWWHPFHREVFPSSDNTISRSGNKEAPFDFDLWPDIARQFDFISSLGEREQRQRSAEVEALVFEIAALAPGLPSQKSYRVRRNDKGGLETDGFIQTHDSSYQVKCHWHSQPMSANAIKTVLRQSRTPGEMSGIVVAKAGYTPEAIEAVYSDPRGVRLLMFNGEELRAMTEGRLRLDEAIRVKEWLSDQASRNIEWLPSPTALGSTHA